jgi:hypothetical protein
MPYALIVKMKVICPSKHQVLSKQYGIKAQMTELFTDTAVSLYLGQMF